MKGNSDVRKRLAEYLAGLTTISLATTGPTGEPCAAAVYFAADADLRLYFLSDKKTIHAQNLLRDSRAAATAHDEHQDWKTLRGAQLRGEARPVGALEFPSAAACYAAKFPFVAAEMGPAALAKALASSSFWVFFPLWVRIIDNSQGFGHKDEIDF